MVAVSVNVIPSKPFTPKGYIISYLTATCIHCNVFETYIYNCINESFFYFTGGVLPDLVTSNSPSNNSPTSSSNSPSTNSPTSSSNSPSTNSHTSSSNSPSPSQSSQPFSISPLSPTNSLSLPTHAQHLTTIGLHRIQVVREKVIREAARGSERYSGRLRMRQTEMGELCWEYQQHTWDIVSCGGTQSKPCHLHYYCYHHHRPQQQHQDNNENNHHVHQEKHDNDYHYYQHQLVDNNKNFPHHNNKNDKNYHYQQQIQDNNKNHWSLEECGKELRFAADNFHRNYSKVS